MSALTSDPSTPAQDAAAPPSIDTQQLQSTDAQSASSSAAPEAARKPKAPSVRRACAACHAGKTRCSEVLPCQSCLKRGLGNSCAYPDPESGSTNQQQQPAFAPPPPLAFPPPPMDPLTHSQYYGYTNAFTGPPQPAVSTPPFRPNKRSRPLTDEEAAAITRNWTRGDFFVGSSAPVRIDPRLPVRLTLAEGDTVHFSIGGIGESLT